MAVAGLWRVNECSFLTPFFALTTDRSLIALKATCLWPLSVIIPLSKAGSLNGVPRAE